MKPPLPKCGPCRVRLGDGTLQDAPYSVVGFDPPSPTAGGGVLYWAWSLEEASSAADAFRAHGYREVKVLNEKSPTSKEVVKDMVLRVLGE
jgi:hypothetical protein